jgi:hypothetical protein
MPGERKFTGEVADRDLRLVFGQGWKAQGYYNEDE